MAENKTQHEYIAREIGLNLIIKLSQADAEYIIVADREHTRREQRPDEEIDRHVRDLDEVVRALRLPMDRRVAGCENWTLGWRMFARRRRRIPGGYVVPILRVPIVRRPPTSVVSYLISTRPVKTAGSMFAASGN